VQRVGPRRALAERRQEGEAAVVEHRAPVAAGGDHFGAARIDGNEAGAGAGDGRKARIACTAGAAVRRRRRLREGGGSEQQYSQAAGAGSGRHGRAA
jgi:hypothetical protein